MDDLYWNKIFGAVLGTGLLVFALKLAGGAMFAAEKPKEAGFKIAVAEEKAGETKKPEGGEAAKVPFAALCAKADKDAGAAKAKTCAACHDFTKGGPNKVGPALYDIVGRDMGVAAGFTYSDSFKTMAGKKWDFEAMDKWLTAPKEFVPGTKMGFAGIPKAEDRANVIAYLASLSDAPKACPAQ